MGHQHLVRSQSTPVSVGRRAAALALVVLLGAVTACQPEGAGSPSRSPIVSRLHRARSFAFAIGVDPLDAAAVARLKVYGLVVVDGASTSASKVASLKADGAIVLAYLSVGTLEPWRPWFATARDNGWLLDNWGDWDEYYAKVAAPGLRSLLAGEATRELAQGFDGLFLDNTDMVEDHGDQTAGMTTLVARLDQVVGPNRLLFSQNGDDSVGAIARYLDGWNREDVTGTYDFDADAYRRVKAGDQRDAIAASSRLRDAGLFVTTTDYTAKAGDATAVDAVARSCHLDVVPFVSDIHLQRLPAEPLRCS